MFVSSIENIVTDDKIKPYQRSQHNRRTDSLGQKDLTTKKLEDYADVFADIFNVLFFKEKILLENKLKSGPTESIYKSETGDTKGQCRDILKRYIDDNNKVVTTFGIENQTTVDDTMPIRIINYDAASYMRQIKEKEAIHPVYTIVLNMSDDRWDKAKSISGMIQTKENLNKKFQNYRLHVYDIAYLENGVIESFQSDFKEIAYFFKERRLGEDKFFRTNKIKFKHPEAVADFLSTFTHDDRYKRIVYNLSDEEKKGGISMCTIAEGLIREGREETLEVTTWLAENKRFEELIQLKDEGVYKRVLKEYKEATGQ
ncbi:MAG: Rpn family recombination-promoting nuclease/putative transposase [Lachnospiraceae bacterium]|nr:Rpn family recombination-promoting nuclease/putative transposase [Lachnospiraceae bacterium]